MRRTTPAQVTQLDDGEVFVFGSNAAGQHGAGAARVAHERFGAEWGVGEGMTGRTYALPTMEGEASFRAAVTRFLATAAADPGTTFLLTKVGCGIAGYDEAVVKTWFASAPVNVVRPDGW